MFDDIINWFKEDSGSRINMAINIAILLALLSTCSRVGDVQKQIDSLHSNHKVVKNSPEDRLRQQIIDTMIQQLNEVKNK